MEEKKRSYVDDIDRSVYDIKDEYDASLGIHAGLTADIVTEISDKKNEPEWMRDFRLKSLEI